jgi:hypothetical protein
MRTYIPGALNTVQPISPFLADPPRAYSPATDSTINQTTIHLTATLVIAAAATSQPDVEEVTHHCQPAK